MLIKVKMVKTRFRKFQFGTSNSLALDSRPCVLCSGREFISCCSCPEMLQEAEIKENGLINLTEEISRQYSIHSVAWTLPAVFN